MLLAVVGGTLGIIWSYWQIGSIDRFKPILPAYMDLQAFISWKALLLTMGASVLTGIFAGLTIFVACLGLFGLATSAAQQRVKEIGVRKVLGATLFNLASLLSKDFLALQPNPGSAVGQGVNAAL